MHSNNKKRGAESKRLTQSTLFTFFTQKKQKTKNNEAKEEVIIEQVVKEEEEERVEIVAKPLSIEKEEHSTHIEQRFSNSIYTQEFDDMVQTVLDGEDYLLDEKELDLCYDPKHLLVRLLMRRHKWIKQDTLDYPLTDTNKAIQELNEIGFIESDLKDIETALHVLTKPELKNIAKERHIDMQETRKNGYIKEIVKYALSDHISYGNSQTIHESKMKKLWDTVNKYLGPCLRVRSEVYDLFQRLQIVYYRITSLHDTNYITSSILAKINRRSYPQYTWSRSNSIWPCRADLLKFEEALLIEKEFETMVKDIPRTRTAGQKDNGEDVQALLASCWSLCESKMSVWDECIYSEQTSQRPYYKRRFEAGWIYTRLLDRGTEILARLHEYELESLILHKLLSQRVYRLGKRGKWYERLALVQMNYLERKDAKVMREQKKCALQTCIDALHDPLVHQIYIHGIQERIKRLERQLSIPKREQHDFSYMSLRKPREITVYGERISNDDDVNKKSIWRTNNGAECSVEEVALEYYAKKGFKGLHAENGIIRMIASLLFWDILFAPIPGVFETPYQTAPLDIRSDAFYESRLDIIQKRLNAIENGDYLDIIKTIDTRERPRQTLCIGVNWNYELEDILEIAECIGPMPLASLCKLLFEEYGQRQSGMPDLCCWNYEKKECLFSEVKGPGDTLSETQKLWIDTLASVGIQVEVCFVKLWKGKDVFLET
ncbi:hypothetical protein G6F68_007571 [Rhizopus microsporus]|nr:hypothetical protein G6F69_008071 [Rhizopus microsporus]KAG1228184.1 hypothetical protein G6F67_007985 [Rhizopus microsporus]KAG1260243.1 hypothetical protein G6F68_007571 [Rhizopus microsporus]